MARRFVCLGRMLTPFAVVVRSLITSKRAITMAVSTRASLRKTGHSRLLCSPASALVEDARTTDSTVLHCAGCGASLQTSDASLPGFTPKGKVEEWQAKTQKLDDKHFDDDFDSDDNSDATGPLICQRCFSLKHYNTALNITLKADDYLRHLSILRDKRALVLLMIDVTDYPASVFPNLNTLISKASRVLIVANKIDLLPRDATRIFWRDFQESILSELRSSSLSDCSVVGVRFVSAKTDLGVEELCSEITSKWGNRGDVYLLGCTNVGKSTLFNKLLTRLCGARPGDVKTEGSPNVPMATISQWPGTTLGLLSFPLLSVGKMKRLLRQRRVSERSQMETCEWHCMQ